MPDSGALKWYYQFTPHDLHDWDATEIPVLIDTDLEGQPLKLLLQANRNGFFYALDRTNGKFLFAKPFVRVTWAKGDRAGWQACPDGGRYPYRQRAERLSGNIGRARISCPHPTTRKPNSFTLPQENSATSFPRSRSNSCLAASTLEAAMNPFPVKRIGVRSGPLTPEAVR